MAARPPRAPPRSLTPGLTSDVADAPDASIRTVASGDSAPSDEQSSGQFLDALASPNPRQLHILAPAVHPAPGALDTVVLHGITLVAYSAGYDAVIARGTDLAALRRLTPPLTAGTTPTDRRRTCTALAFRARDGALAVAFGNKVVVFEGWSPAASLRGSVFDSSHVETILKFPGTRISSLAWSKDGSRLAAFGDVVTLWDAGEPEPVLTIPAEGIPAQMLDLGAMSPDGRLLSAAAMHGTTGWVWWVSSRRKKKKKKDSMDAFDLRASTPNSPAEITGSSSESEHVPLEQKLSVAWTEIQFGHSGVASMEWKPRGGGQAALMTSDRDGSLRLWTKASPNRPSFDAARPHSTGNVVSSSNSAPEVSPKPGSARASPSTEAEEVSAPGYNSFVAPKSPPVPPMSEPGESWMVEIARGPHVESSERAGAAFVHWGGGGGVADDESDAAANAAAHPYMADGAAPKPSRAHHWIVRVAGGDARAWRVRGLDDQPRPEFARLEPGSGRALVDDSFHMYNSETGASRDASRSSAATNGQGSRDHAGAAEKASRTGGAPKHRHEHGMASLRGASVAALRAIAPVPLSTSSKRRAGLVKSYAISNGERRLRSSEPPEPPSIAAVYVLLTRGGAAFLARYDCCPTQDAPAACRARVGAGHSSLVTRLEAIPSYVRTPSHISSMASWLLSTADGGDTLLWRADAASPTREPLVLTGRLPGPHIVAAFAPASLVAQTNTDSVAAMFAVDALTSGLHLYRFRTEPQRRTCSNVQSVILGTRVVSSARGPMPGDPLTQLKVVPLKRSRGRSKVVNSCMVLGIAASGRTMCWRVSRGHGGAPPRFEPTSLRVKGQHFGSVSAADVAVELGTAKRLLAVGSADGCLRLYEIVVDAGDETGYNQVSDIVAETSSAMSVATASEDSDDGEDGLVRLREAGVLEEHRAESPQTGVMSVAIMSGGERIAALREDGSVVVWERGSSISEDWHVAVSLRGEDMSPANGASQPHLHFEGAPALRGGLAFGRDASGQLALFVSGHNGSIVVLKRAQGTSWEQKLVIDSQSRGFGPLSHVGSGIVVTGCDHSVLAMNASIPPKVVPGGSASFAPSRVLLAHLLSGGHAWQVISVLEELAAHVDDAVRLSPARFSYTSGGSSELQPMPPSLRVLLSTEEAKPGADELDLGLASARVADQQGHTVGGAASGRKSQSLFEVLMAESERKIAAEHSGSRSKEETEESSADTFGKLEKRLHRIQLDGLSQLEQNVLADLTSAAASVRDVLSSLDPSGARFALLAATYLKTSREAALPPFAFACAVHSSAADALSNHFLVENRNRPKTFSNFSAVNRGLSDNPGGSTAPALWQTARRIGAGWWLSTSHAAKTLVERIARAEFNDSRNPDNVALWYVALGKAKTLAALYKAQQNLRMAEFMARNFTKTENRQIASKNAYVLISKHRLYIAAAFFILAGDTAGALGLIRSRLRDEQLAVILARVLDSGEHVDGVLGDILSSKTAGDDPHLRSIVLWLSGEHRNALDCMEEAASHRPWSAAEGQELGRALGNHLEPSALAYGHLVALVDRPPIRGSPEAAAVVRRCRQRAMHALTADGNCLSAMRLGFELLTEVSDDVSKSSNQEDSIFPSSPPVPQPASSPSTVLNNAFVGAHLVYTTVKALQERAVNASKASRAHTTSRTARSVLEADLQELCGQRLTVAQALQAACMGAGELCRHSEIDSAAGLALAALSLSRKEGMTGNLSDMVEMRVVDVFYLGASRCVYRSLCALSPLRRPNVSAKQLASLVERCTTAVRMLRQVAKELNTRRFNDAINVMKRGILAADISGAYLRGDWVDMLAALRCCESPSPATHTPDGVGSDEDDDEGRSPKRTVSSALSADAISLESLRHIASNPAVLGISPRIGHRRRRRPTPSLALVDVEGASSAVMADESMDGRTLGESSNDPISLIRAHPALSSSLGNAAIAYLTAHQAARAAELVASQDYSAGPSRRRDHLGRVANLARLLEASESFEHVASDALAGWIPLERLGSNANDVSLMQANTDESVGAFVELWSALGCLPEYAPSLSEAATVAAAEVAAAAAQRVSADESKLSARRRRRAASKRGATEGSRKSKEIFDTTSADALSGAYPVRFSAAETGPWSGRGRFASLYVEESALFRTLCVSSSDPPAVIVASPKGVQEIVPSSYTAMPTGFRAHYFARRSRKALEEGADEPSRDTRDHESAAVPHAPEAVAKDDHAPVRDDTLDFFETSFGEGHYVPLEMSSQQRHSRGSLVADTKGRSASVGGRKLTWRHQVEATALAAHPMRRRFASGTSDGSIYLWEFGDPVALACLRSRGYGRVAAVRYSSYGDSLLSVHASGYVAIWADQDASFHGRPQSESSGINAFHGRAGRDATFIDEGFVIATVGDATSPPAVGHSLRVFDIRDPTSAYSANWSARVNGGGDATCVALLDDRVRLATGGENGSLCTVDLRMSRGSAFGGGIKHHVSEIPAHGDRDEITCLATESPRGRALVSGSRNGDIRVWDSRTLLQLDHIIGAHPPRRHYWSGSGIAGLVGSYGTQAVALTDRSLISCGGDGIVKIWGPGWSTNDLNVL